MRSRTDSDLLVDTAVKFLALAGAIFIAWNTWGSGAALFTFCCSMWITCRLEDLR